MENNMITGNADIIRALMATKKICKDKRARTIHLLKNQKTPKKATKRQMDESNENERLRAVVQAQQAELSQAHKVFHHQQSRMENMTA
jgi:hypothetical protein